MSTDKGPTPGDDPPAGDSEAAEATDAIESDAVVDADVVDAEVIDAEVVEVDAAADTESDDSAKATQDGDGADPMVTDEDAPVDILLTELTRERDTYLESLRQVQADFENFRKQAVRRQGDAIEHATGRLVEDLLSVLDACDAGIEHGDQGVIAIYSSLLGVLEKSGLERLEPTGESFDPNAHEAVLHEPADDGAEGTDGPIVDEVMRPGYRWKGRTLRAAMVKVKG